MVKQFIVTLRVGIACQDEVQAELITEEMRETILESLDTEEDGDFVQVTQIIPFESIKVVSPQEICDVLRRDRNILIRTRIKELWDIARSIDEVIHRLSTGQDELAGYDYGHMLELATKLFAGENPID